ncbi:MAG: hypothetical protein GTN40_00175 [Candidatus Aenigmarchaeota archaeon]|nr:hypothetical protein [Candidatus Aenigmarchaeota archaeon]
MIKLNQRKFKNILGFFIVFLLFYGVFSDINFSLPKTSKAYAQGEEVFVTGSSTNDRVRPILRDEYRGFTIDGRQNNVPIPNTSGNSWPPPGSPCNSPSVEGMDFYAGGTWKSCGLWVEQWRTYSSNGGKWVPTDWYSNWGSSISYSYSSPWQNAVYNGGTTGYGEPNVVTWAEANGVTPIWWNSRTRMDRNELDQSWGNDTILLRNVFNVSETDLDESDHAIIYGIVNDWARVYINGIFVGEKATGTSVRFFNNPDGDANDNGFIISKSLLRPGQNLLAIQAASKGVVDRGLEDWQNPHMAYKLNLVKFPYVLQVNSTPVNSRTIPIALIYVSSSAPGYSGWTNYSVSQMTSIVTTLTAPEKVTAWDPLDESTEEYIFDGWEASGGGTWEINDSSRTVSVNANATGNPTVVTAKYIARILDDCQIELRDSADNLIAAGGTITSTGANQPVQVKVIARSRGTGIRRYTLTDSISTVTLEGENEVIFERSYAPFNDTNYDISIEVEQGELTTSCSTNFTILVPDTISCVSITAVPKEGTPPLTVNFTAVATDNKGRQLVFDWDFDQSKTDDNLDNEPGTPLDPPDNTRYESKQTYNYTTSGLFNVIVTVRRTDGTLNPVSCRYQLTVKPQWEIEWKEIAP